MDKKFDVNSLRVASPCSVGWETMTGDERSRHCELCSLNVYNISELTAREVEGLIAKREGRLCIRLYRRLDGTVLTRDCPVGLRAVRKRVATFAGAAMATVLGLFSVSFAQKRDKTAINAAKANIVRTAGQTQTSQLSGVVTDTSGAIIPGAEILLYQKGNKTPWRAVSTTDGTYQFPGVSEGVYTLQVKTPNFAIRTIVGIDVGRSEMLGLNLELRGEPVDMEVMVGMTGEEPLIDTSSATVKHVITRRMLDSLPH